MLEINNLKATVEGTTILNGLTLKVKPGEVHAIMGPNGSGKSTLSNTLMGRDGYVPDSGSVTFKGKNLLEMEVEERAREGMFLALQYPTEIPGVNTNTFLRFSVNAIRKHQGKEPLDSLEFVSRMKEQAKQLSIGNDMLTRSLNTGFSGGEKKKNEVLQMTLLQPELIIMDETDSGLDVDALRIVSDGVNKLRNNNRSFIIITHYQRLLDYIKPDFVHILSDGKIIKTGDASLALEVEKNGYSLYNN
jgi:Fe-S cluster assembly ATP-binding protein